jgi:hypothetical protein
MRCVGDARPQSTRGQARDEHTHTTMIRPSALIRAGFFTHRGCETQRIVENTTPALDSALFCGRGGSRLIERSVVERMGVPPIQQALRHASCSTMS